LRKGEKTTPTKKKKKNPKKNKQKKKTKPQKTPHTQKKKKSMDRRTLLSLQEPREAHWGRNERGCSPLYGSFKIFGWTTALLIKNGKENNIREGDLGGLGPALSKRRRIGGKRWGTVVV